MTVRKPDTKLFLSAAALILLASPQMALANTLSDDAATDTQSTDDATQDVMEDDQSVAAEVADKAGNVPFYKGGGRLLLTGGVSQIEGAAGGGLTPWALIGGYGTRNEIGAGAFVTGVNSRDFSLTSFGGQLSYANRVEVSIARQSFNLNAVGDAIGLGREYSIRQTIFGAKVRLIGDAVLEQDSLLPQIAVGVQYKVNDDKTVVAGALGLKRKGLDFYASATKVILSESLLLNATGRLTKANQFGILGFGGLGGMDQKYKLQFEGSVAYLLTRKLAVGAEFRTKSNRLEGALGGTTFREENAKDVFIAFAPSRNVSLTLAYVDLGQIALRDQDAAYASLQIGF